MENKSLKKEILIGIIILAFTLPLTDIWEKIKPEYFKKNDLNHDFKIEKHKELYSKGTQKYKEIREVYIELNSILIKQYGLTPIEYKNIFDKFENIKLDLIEYRRELEKFSTDDIIISINNIVTIMQGDLQLLWIHAKNSDKIEDSILSILYNVDSKKLPEPSEELVNKINLKIEQDLITFIDFENEIYFRIIDFSFPLIDALENNFNQKFRKKLKLGTTDTLNKKLAEIPILIQKWKSYTYAKQEFPFVLASFRTFSSPSLNLQGNLLKYKEKENMAIVATKFFMSASSKLYNKDISNQSNK